MICWRCHNKSVNTGSRLLNISDFKTRKRPNMIGIDMIRNKRIKKICLSVIIVNYVIIFINFYESSFCWALNFHRNFQIFIESKLRKIHIMNAVKTSCEDNIWTFSLNCTFFISSFSSATFLNLFFSAFCNLRSFLIISNCNRVSEWVSDCCLTTTQ